MDIGIVMPVYTQLPSHLKTAIRSILNQTFRSYRLIVVIDGDPSMEPLVRAEIASDPRGQIVSCPVNQGVAEALNVGFTLLLQDPAIRYLTWVSSDNFYYPEFLEILHAAIHTGPEQLGLVYSSFRPINEKGIPIFNEATMDVQRQSQAQPKERLLDYCLIGVSFLYKTEHARKIGFYRMAPVEDYDYWLRLTEVCETRFIPAELMDYRVNAALSVSAQLKSFHKHRHWRYMFHLVRHLARGRRGIPSPLTALCAVSHAGPREIALVESLYNQAYSSCTLQIIDVSPSGQANASLAEISHPTTQFEWRPGCSPEKALLEAVRQIRTPLAMVLGVQPFPDNVDIDMMMKHLQHMDSRIASCYYVNHPDLSREIRTRSISELSVFPLADNELFRTEHLVRVLSSMQQL